MKSSKKKAALLSSLVLSSPVCLAANTTEQGIKSGYYVNDFRIRPSVSISEIYDDNIFATDTQSESDFITIVSPRLNVDTTWDKHSLRFKLGADLARYSEFDAENYNDYWLTLDGKYDINEVTAIFGGLGFSSKHENRDSPDAASEGLSPTTYESRNANIGIKTRYQKTTFRIGMTYEDLDFDDVFTSTGSSVINNDRDRELLGLGIRATHKLDETLDLYAQVLLDKQDYKRALDIDGFNKDSDGYRFAAGYKKDHGNGNKSEAYLGLINQDYDDSRFESISAVDIGGQVTLQPSSKSRLMAGLLRTLNETTVSGSSSYLHTALTGKLEYKISQRFIPHLKLGYAESIFKNSDREDTILSGEAAIKYYLARNASLTAGFRHVDRDSNDLDLMTGSNDYTNNSIFLTFTTQGYPLFEPAVSAFDTQGELEIGAFWLSDDSKRFGRYSGLDSSGTHLNGNVILESADTTNNWAVIEGYNLGLDSRSLELDWGAQGQYSAYVLFDQQPFTRFTGSTLFEGIGSTSLTLPAGWTRGLNTSPAQLPDLAASLQSVEIGTMRKKLGAGASFIKNKNWTINLDYESQTKEGFMPIAGAIGHSPGEPSRSVILPAPVDYTTNSLKASVDYANDGSMFSLALHSSFFMNNLKSLDWENPFDDSQHRGDKGSISLAPDNQFHQLSLSGTQILSGTTRLTGVASFAAMYQDDPFLPDAVASGLIPNPLPRNSLDGEVYQTNALLALTSRPLSGLNLKASYRLQKRDNETPVASYTYHVNDGGVGGVGSSPKTATNTPYSYDRRTLDLSAGYRLNSKARLNGNIARETYECSPCEVAKTTEDETNLRLRLTPSYDFQVTLRGGVSERDGSAYQTLTGENALLRKYNISDRKRSLAGMDVSYQPTDQFVIAANLQFSDDDYDATSVGLTSSKQTGVTVDASYHPNEKLSAHAYIGREMIESKQSGSQVPNTADWFVDNDDAVDSLGFGITWQKNHKLKLGMDYTFSGATGKTFMTSQSVNPPVTQFPDLTSDLHSVKLYADYQWHRNTSVKLSYQYEEFEVNDWSVDGVNVDTIPEVLLLGESNPGYKEHLIGVSLITRF
ncbi:MAG: MtrB/PioB family decaheme-associated outer membrane protein [Gammaproteobacteria bacterium]|nr:MtrB/PioB family decaheme-associated outer membrane protein [Gammaproteobacteria bacterium]